MPEDFGGRKPRNPIGLPVIIVGGIVLIAAFLVGSWFWQLPRNVTKAEAWAISGPPCQPLSAQAFQAQPVRISDRFEVDDITFGRAGGHVSCDDIHDNGGRGLGTFTECQFTGPGVLQVTTSAGDADFLTAGDPATVTVKKGVVSCVLAAKFKGETSIPGGAGP